MNTLLKIVSLLALSATSLPSCLYFLHVVDHDFVKMWALVGTLAWFLSASLWMGHRSGEAT